MMLKHNDSIDLTVVFENFKKCHNNVELTVFTVET